MNTSELIDFVEKHNLHLRCTEAFKEYLREWEMENPTEFRETFNCKLDVINSKVAKVQLVVNYRFDEPIEYVQFTLDVIGSEQTIAQYNYLVDLNGIVMDDSMVFEK